MADNFKIRFLNALWEDYLYNDNFKDTVIYKHIYEKEYNRALQCEKSGKPGTSDLSRLILMYKGCSRGDFFLKLIELLSTTPKTFFEKKTIPGRDTSLQENLLDELFRFFNEGAVQKNIFGPKDVPSLTAPVKESVSSIRKLKTFIKSLHRDLSSLPKEEQKTISKKIGILEKRDYPFMEEIYETLMCIGIQHKFISEFLYNYGVTVAEEEYEIKIVKLEDDDNAEEVEESQPILVFDKTDNPRKKDDTLGLISSCFEDPNFLHALLPNYSSSGEQSLAKIQSLWTDYLSQYMKDKKAPDFYDFKYADYTETFTLLTNNAETGVGLYILGSEHFTDYVEDDLPLPFLPAILSFHELFDETADRLFSNRSYVFNMKYNGNKVLKSDVISSLISSGHPEEILAVYYEKYKEAIEEAKGLLS